MTRKPAVFDESLLCMEREAAAQGLGPVCGVDEVGRGPLAGPVYAAAVILPEGICLDGLDDSKKLSPARREELDARLRETAIFAVASADEAEIEALNILGATLLAMRRAVRALPVTPHLALVDGNCDPRLTVAGAQGGEEPLKARCVVKGDATCACIAAASVIAKVARDAYMATLDRLYPQYGFAEHKGYGTTMHIERLREYGASPVHRMSFLKKYPDILETTRRLGSNRPGDFGEAAASRLP